MSVHIIGRTAACAVPGLHKAWAQCNGSWRELKQQEEQLRRAAREARDWAVLGQFLGIEMRDEGLEGRIM